MWFHDTHFSLVTKNHVTQTAFWSAPLEVILREAEKWFCNLKNRWVYSMGLQPENEFEFAQPLFSNLKKKSEIAEPLFCHSQNHY